MELEVDVQQLAASASDIIGYGETLAVTHSCADSRMASAASGWKGRSAAALDNRLSMWSTRVTALVTRMGEQGNAVHLCASAFEEHEADAARAMESLRPKNGS
ncbi:WXG100 family type VII secretion target [Mycolicibacterium mengxianglii]|uniref:WXG100 family type VII secretion target n=1 Tax=Mycolicibacterium mengxianglii TaxID=2736649 RepID=UPI0018D0DEE3|nr:WXG100 family type VII secretion target [Mycolicibacterium mengxianglii]